MYNNDCIILILLCTLLSVLSQRCPDRQGPTIVKEGKECNSVDKICDPSVSKKQVTFDFDIEVDAISTLRCLNEICVQDYTLDNGDTCESDLSCKSSKGCKGDIEKTCVHAREVKPDHIGSDCSEVELCFGDNLVCLDDKCVEVEFAAQGKLCEPDSLIKKCRNKMYCAPPLNKNETHTCEWILPENATCTTPGVTLQCTTRLCGSEKKCITGKSVDEPCSNTDLCAWDLICTSDRVCKKPSIEVEAEVDTCVLKEGEQCRISPTLSVCSCDDEILICSNSLFVKQWSKGEGESATSPRACFGDLWWSKSEKRCVKELLCSQSTDCYGASPVTTPLNDKQYVYCGCDNIKNEADQPDTKFTCKIIKQAAFKCTPAEVASSARAYCTTNPDMSQLAKRSTVVDGLSVTVSFEDYSNAFIELQKAQVRKQDLFQRCVYGTIFNDSGAHPNCIPSMFLIALLVIAFGYMD
eukprot:TRINITY_DN103084_c0_g1_i1.p1 TRINITY_DN103084_c0_g1~~TRINITY_DN103084_c0_g1_i1.p1  ORF type:complete len:467 (-),score=10.54 TRINITY_DN103084_c0_g1_i1:743-2143(-)